MGKEIDIIETNPVINKDGATVNLPKDFVKYLGLKKEVKLFLIPTNGVIQISPFYPLSTIPAISKEKTNFFEKQTN